MFRWILQCNLLQIFDLYSAAPCKTSTLAHLDRPSWNLDGQTSWMLNTVAHLSGSELLLLMSGQWALVDGRTPESSWKRQLGQQLISHAAPAEGKLTPHMHTKPESLWKYILSVLAAFLCSKTKKFTFYILSIPPCLEASRDDLRGVCAWCVFVRMWACCHYIIPLAHCDCMRKYIAAVCFV